MNMKQIIMMINKKQMSRVMNIRKINRIKELMPDAFIGVDLMVGTRGETEELFEESRRFVDGLDITRLHVFPYSERPGTLALRTIDHVVDQHTKSVRAGKMIALSDRKLRAFMQQYAGTVRPVLFEQPQPGMPMHGFTDNYIRVEVSDAPEALVNTVAQVRLLSISPDDPDTMLGEVVTQQ